MRFPAAVSAALASFFLASLASAQDPDGATPEAGSKQAAPAASTAAPPAPPPDPAAAPVAASAPALDIVPAEPDQPILEPIPSAHDTLGHHFVLGAAAGAKWPFGSLSDGTKQRSELGAGLAFNLDLGFGLSRNVVLGAWGEFDTHGSPSECHSCSTNSFAGGPFVRYHIVQGTRFDPWGAIAVGVRHTSVDRSHTTVGGNAGTSNFFGPDWLRLTLGGDWYPLANFGVGPYVELDFGAYNSHPRSATVDTTVHTGLGTGLRLVLDFPGK
jgi:hypothetical protein